MTKKRRIISTFLAACMVTSSMIGMSVPASADPVGSTYSIVIPSTLTVANSGWNNIGNISATGTLEEGKKLTVTASSANSWALKSGENTVSYTLNNGSTEKGDAATSWEFTKEQLSTGATQAIGIDVADYSNKPAGTYQDTVTFTASVVDNSVKVTSITLNKTSTVIGVNGEKTLSVSQILPTDATDKTYTWASDNTSIATVDSNGKVTGVAIGTANITATANDGSGIKATCVVKVALSETIMVKGHTSEMPFDKSYTYVGTNFQVACDKTDVNATQIWQGDSKMVITTTSGKTIISVDLEGPDGGSIENGNTLVLSSGTIDGNTVNNVNAESLTIGQVSMTQTELGSVTIYYQ